MSGITPLLDTLLHQVLGKRVDFQTAPEAAPPVGPAFDTEAVRQVRSDSRLDARIPLLLMPDADQQDATGPSKPLQLPAGAPASTSTQLSPAARTIADVLLTHPAKPSTIEPTNPLLPAGSSPQATSLAGLLKQSISESGLFYEAHLARWFQGELPVQALTHEPQMRGWRPPRDNETASPQPAVGQSSTPTLPDTQPLDGDPTTALPWTATPSVPTPSATDLSDKPREPLPQETEAPRDTPLSRDELQGIVRHQLELLVSPTLRWQGEAWAGMLMTLLLQAPDADRNDSSRDRPDDGRGADSGDTPEWKVQLDLQLPTHGPLRLDARLAAQQLSLTLVSASDGLLGYFEQTREALRERLLQCGLTEVKLHCRDSRKTSEIGDD